MDEISELARRGDGLRDSGDPIRAAQCYRRIVELNPDVGWAWVQLGNMLKDTKQYAEAEAAYRTGLIRGSDPSDTNLQLARALRGRNSRDEAIRALLESLKAAPKSEEAVGELLSWGEFWLAQQASNIGAFPLTEITAALSQVRSTLDRIERALPPVLSLATLPVDQWDLWKSLWRLPVPAPVSKSVRIVVFANDAPLHDVLGCMNSIERLSHGAVTAEFVSSCVDVRDAVIRRASLFPRLYPVERACEPPRSYPKFKSDAAPDYVLLACEPLVFERHALEWLISEGFASNSFAAFSDEDIVKAQKGDTLAGPAEFYDPWLKGAADPEMLDQGVSLGSFVAVRSDVFDDSIAAMQAAELETGGLTWWIEWQRRIFGVGPISHVARCLCSRLRPGHTRRSQSATPRVVLGEPARAAAIDVIIPNKNKFELLSRCLDALFRTSSRPDSIKLTIVDNGSDQEALALFAGQMASRSCHIVSEQSPFNWSRMNNIAASMTSSTILLFLNNDVELLTPGWDDAVRLRLAAHDVGAVGARLFYPDRTVQHAGIVLGAERGWTAHEGRGRAADDPGPHGRWHLRRSVSAVTGAFLACRRDVYHRSGGFDETRFPIWFSDIDYCLQLRAQGLRLILDPDIQAIHYESQTLAVEVAGVRAETHHRAAYSAMHRKWGANFVVDHYFNENYDRIGVPFRFLRAPTSACVC